MLRWLRNGMLLCVAAAALLYLWVAVQAGGDIAASRRTIQAIRYVGDAGSAVSLAGKSLSRVFSTEDVPLVGTGTVFASQITEVYKYLTLAAENSAAGANGTNAIQYAENEFTSYLEQSETAVHDYDSNGQLGSAGEGYAQAGQVGAALAIVGLRGTEQATLHAQGAEWALDPGVFWWVLLGPVIGMLALVAATATVLTRHFRRPASPWLWGSLVITSVTVIAAGVFNSADARHLAADPWAGRPVTMAITLLLLLAAAAMALRAYHPRLAEYLFDQA